MIYQLAVAGFAIGGLCGIWRLLVGPSLADRVIGLDVALICLMGGITVDAAARNDTTFLILLVVVAIIGFASTVSVARFIELGAPETAAPETAGENGP